MLLLMTSAAIVDIVKSCLVVLTALFPIVNPLGSSPIFLSLTPGYSSEERAALVLKITLNSYWLLLGSLLIGSHILKFFGISVPVVQIGGGIVVMFTGWTLLQGEPEPSRATVEETKVGPHDIATRAFYPLTLPLTVGPGSISVAIAIGANQVPHRSGVVRLISAIVGSALVAITVYLSYRFADRLAKILGPNGMNVIVRLMSFILLCIGVQILWNGIHALVSAAY